MTSHRRTRRDPPMRTGDTVAPKLTRRTGYLITVAGLAVFIAAVVVGFLIANGSIRAAQEGAQDARQVSGLTQTEVDELRSYLTDRGRQRDEERAEVQAQLDRQTAALCAALDEVARDASGGGRAALARAGKRIGCDALPPSATSAATPTPGGTGTSSAGTSTPPAAAGDAPAADPAPAVPRPAAPAAPAPRPTPVPAPAPTTPPAAQPERDGGLLDPITEPVCNLLGVCL